jgi:hypothetical protein
MDTISFGSFPRSGSHFCLELLHKSLSDIKIVRLEHRIYPLDKQKNVFTTIRTPIECVPSWITLTADVRNNRAEQILEWYCAYYEKCKEVCVLTIPFTQLISEPLFALNQVYKTFGFPLIDSLDFNLDTGFHFPTKDKSNYHEIIQEMQSAPNFPRAMSLFEELCVSVVR